MRHPLFLVAACAAAVSCGDGGSTDTPAPVATVTISPNPASVTVGEAVQLTAALEDASGNTLSGRTVTWSSDPATVATVSGTGVVTGSSEGDASITATSEGKSGSAVVTVTTSGPLLGPGESGVLFTVIDPTDQVRRAGDIQPKARRPDTQYRLLGLVNWQAYTLGMVPGRIFVPAGTLGMSLVVPPGSLRGAQRITASAGSRAAPITSSVLFAGGYLDATSVNSSPRAVLYRPSTNDAVELTMHAARIYYTITPLSGSRALLAGGFDGDEVLSSAEIFSESSASFALTGAMGTARGRHAAAVLPDGRVLITGGLVPQGTGPVTIDTRSTEIFDPATGTFAAGPDMGVARFNHSAIALDDGRVLVLGGNQLSSAEVYDPVANGFSPVGAMSRVHGLGHRAVKLLDGKVLVIGGDEATIQPSEAAELFDPATDEFTSVGNMATKRMLHFAVVNANDGRVLVGGGQDETGELLASAEVYDPATGTFSPAVNLHAEDSEQAAVFVQQ